MTESESTRIALVVDDDKLDKWDNFANSNAEYDNRSDLIRTAVAHEIAGRHKLDMSGQSAETNVEMGKVLDGIGDLSDAVASISDRLTAVENEVRTDEEMEELATRVFEALPTEEELSPLDIEYRSGGEHVAKAPQIEDWGPENDTMDEIPLTEVDDDMLRQSGHLLALAEYLGEPAYKAQDALDKLGRDTHMLGQTGTNGETLYYREA